MTFVIQISEIEHLSETELRQLHSRVLDDLIRSGLTFEESPLVALSLDNIKLALHRRRLKGPRL